jgi:FkbM family methyltransferase
MSKLEALLAYDVMRRMGSYTKRQRATFGQYRELISKLGLRGAIEYRLLKKCDKSSRAVHILHLRRTTHPLSIRANSSDIGVFDQIFIEAEYACLNELVDIRLIVDLGANVGYSSAYFLSHFPEAQVIAVEPDPTNFALLERNMSPYGNRVRTVHAGIWSHPTRLVIRNTPYRDGGEWTRQVQECGATEKGDIEGVDLDTLLKRSGHERISLLKIDIEGAEAVIFAQNYKSWIDKVSTIVIELHDDSAFGEASDVFFSAIRGLGFQVARSGELTICSKRALGSGLR